jgi:hypothetical protein
MLQVETPDNHAGASGLFVRRLDVRRQALSEGDVSDLAPLRRGFFCGRALCNQPASRPVELAG